MAQPEHLRIRHTSQPDDHAFQTEEWRIRHLDFQRDDKLILRFSNQKIDDPQYVSSRGLVGLNNFQDLGITQKGCPDIIGFRHQKVVGCRGGNRNAEGDSITFG